MSRGEICCALAHLELYELMIDRNIPWACVLEDDAIPLGDFTEVFNSFATFPMASILGLNAPLSKSDENPKLSKREIVSNFEPENRDLIKLVHPRLQTYAYLINLEAARLIVKRKGRKTKVSARADWPLEIYPGIDFFVCDKPKFTHNDDRSDSIISQERYREEYRSTGILGSILRSRFARMSGLTYLVLAISYVNFKSIFFFIVVKKFGSTMILGRIVQKFSSFN
jgi:GR25 family glycosyltransferase involved in LPS biosynthesis